MPTLNGWLRIYGLKNSLKTQILLFFSEALSIFNQITNENTKN